MANEMKLVQVVAEPLLVVKGRVPLREFPEVVFPMMDRVWTFIRARELTGHGHNVWLYRSPVGEQLDVEVGVQLATELPLDDGIDVSEVPAGLAAHTFLYGEYDQLPGVHSGLVTWCREQGHALSGVSWEVYGDWDDDPAKRRTDIYHQCLG